MNVIFKCRKCRTPLIDYPSYSLVNAHGHLIQLALNNNSPKIDFIDTTEQSGNCEDSRNQCSSLKQDVFYIDDVNVPEWITLCIDEGDWTKGKLKCPQCTARVGSFDFVSGFHCQCQLSVVPSIHLVKSKVDYRIS
ncbi:E3 ubiquitin-protein ligase RNF180-like [Macrosteles quadrilineatus]|uniref:E3 ubiquitin-protein ligase RNF180-like n=1 Tax=Macrosteles quadrilineatus TaxID=74068 RepID=UPI0023E17595|nr:E3 ubiquitin-protein ligase RNF180-like [Macrosteles quadrilineatus]XP_054261643.1 E3 ubiquitin-protein ligase RNF180-like [Macrosteles quadrilineatus]